ncbi:Major Facilitator Superfamily protein [Sphingobium faniae]|nr:Major Facilitator Superfamily protein [Sphingobium faniae]
MTARQWSILSLLMAAEVVSGFESSMILAGLGAWLRIYGDPIGVGWIVSAYMLVSAAAAALCGRLGDIYGRKRMLVIVIVITGCGSLISAVAPSLTWVVIGRAIQGLAGAIIPLCYGLAREHMPANKLSIAIGAITATAAAASAAGLLLGGVLTDHFGPQSIFWASGVTALLIAPILMSGLPGSLRPVQSGTIDWLGGILFAPAIGALLLVFSNGRNWGWTSAATLWLALAGIALLAIWYWHERRLQQPLIDVRLLGNRNCLLGNLIMACAAVGVMQMTQLTSLLLQQPTWTGAGLGTTATFVGILKFPALFLGIISSLLAGWAVGRYGGKAPVLLGCLLMTVASTIGVFEAHSILLLFVTICLGSMGVTAVYAALPSIIIAASPHDRTSEATGLMAVVRSMSQAIGAQVLAICLASSTILSADGKAFPDSSAYMLAFLFMAIASFLGFALGIGLPKNAARQRSRINS